MFRSHPDGAVVRIHLLLCDAGITLSLALSYGGHGLTAVICHIGGTDNVTVNIVPA